MQKDYHVVIAHYNEDLSWVNNLQYPYTIISKKNILLETWPNKGYEASSYLQYIIENYDKISEYTIFVHGHRNSWHNSTNVDKIVNQLNCIKKYKSINNLVKNRGILTNREFMIFLEDHALGRKYNPYNHMYVPGAMFYVHRNQIHLYNIYFYQKLYDFIKNYKGNNELGKFGPSYEISRIFEYSWHILFCNDEYDPTIDDLIIA